MKIYYHSDIKMVADLHKEFLAVKHKFKSINSLLKIYAKEIEIGFNNRNPAMAIEVSNYFPPYLGAKVEVIFSASYSEKDFLNIAANVHGFHSFEEARAKNRILNQEFENAVDILLLGDMSKLKYILKNNPNIIHQSSQFGHQAQLIHYCASNAVELYRQVVPYNLIEIIELLVSCGANLKAKIPVYGGEFDFFELFLSSAHPKEAGLLGKIKSSSIFTKI